MANLSPRGYSTMPNSPENQRSAYENRRSALVMEAGLPTLYSTERMSPARPEVPQIAIQHDSRLSSPRNKHLSEVLGPSSRSSYYRNSPRRSDLSSPPASPLAEVPETQVLDDYRNPNMLSPRNRTPLEAAGLPPISTSHRNSHRISELIPSPKSGSPPGSPRKSCPQPRAKILFYHKHDLHYGFTNFSAHPVIYKGKKYSTSEHLFQSFKFQEHRPGLAEHIRTCSERPSVAFSEARRFQPEVRPDWKYVNVAKMDITLELKFTQHADLKDELLATGDAELVEDSDKDAFWGIGADGTGRNELGKALERLRDKFRQRHSHVGFEA